MRTLLKKLWIHLRRGSYQKKKKQLLEPERMAINTVIQGSAADMIKLAMIELQKELKSLDWPARMLLQIHDELHLCAAGVAQDASPAEGPQSKFHAAFKPSSSRRASSRETTASQSGRTPSRFPKDAQHRGIECPCFQVILYSLMRKPRIVFFSGKPFLLCRSHNLTVLH